MSQFSNYVQKQLKTFLSINSISRKSVQSAQCLKKNYSSQTSNFKIKRNQAVMSSHLSGRPLKQNSCKILTKNNHLKNLFFENMFLEQNIMNGKQKIKKSKEIGHQIRFPNKEPELLIKKLQSVKKTRLKREKYLFELMRQTQKLEKILNLKMENQQKYLKSKQLQKQPIKKSRNIRDSYEREDEEQKKQKYRRRKTVHTMITKLNNFVIL